MEMFHVEPEMATVLHDMSDEDLWSFAEIQEDLATDTPIELYIYTHFLIFKRIDSMEYLECAVQRAEVWVAETLATDPDQARRRGILDTMVAERVMLEDRRTSEDSVQLTRLATILIAIPPTYTFNIPESQARRQTLKDRSNILSR